jgi:hypothetical protein
MIPYDRVVGNLLEWGFPFLGIFWVNLSAYNSTQFVWMGWVYVVARVVYVFVAIKGKGIGKIGANPVILIATIPAYLALTGLAVATIWKLV